MNSTNPASASPQPPGLAPLAPLAVALAPDEGYNRTALSSVRVLRSNRPLARTPVLYDPGIVIVCQGRKRGYFGRRTYVYDAHQYLAVSVPVPFTMETDASAEAPLLALYLHLEFPLKAVTCTSPMQYLKSTRLHQARLLMVQEGMTAAAACHAVGFESASQFSREFKRLFGLTPAREARRMREGFALPHRPPDAPYVSSH